MSGRVVALSFDSADVALVNQWMDQGHLPHLASIRDEGLYVRLQSFEHSLAEIAQQFIVTGQSPERTGYWSQLRFDPAHYSLIDAPLYDFAEYPPFYALGPAHRVCVLDLPQMNFHEAVNGLQLRGWGAHAPMCEFSARPPSWAETIRREVGLHPSNGHDFAVLQDEKSLDALHERLLQGVEMREKLYRLAWDQGPWDLFLGIFSEIHLAGHYLFEHVANRDYLQRGNNRDYLREIYIKTDAAIGKIRGWIEPDMHLALFSVEGIRENSDEVSSIAILPELLFRFSFPGRKAMDFENVQPSPESRAGIFDWVMEAWNLRCRMPRWAKWLRSKLSLEQAQRIEHFFKADGYLQHPAEIEGMNYQPALWYRSYWKQMKAFALPSFSDGFIRINLRGREKHGMVDPASYDSICSELEELLMELKHPETGRPVVKKIIRTRKAGQEENPKLPSADLVILWDHPHPCGHVHSRLGSLGPFPGIRAGQHVPEGFMMISGPRIPRGSRLPSAHVLDIHPTLLDLMGVAPVAPLEGRSLLARLKANP